MSTVSFVRNDTESRDGISVLFLSISHIVFFQKLLHRPPETPGAVCIDGFKDQKNRPGFEEENRADESCDARGVVSLVGEFRRRSHGRQEHEKAIHDPYAASEREDKCD